MTGQFLRSLAAKFAAFAALLPAAALAQDAGLVAGQPVPGQIGLQPSVTPLMDSIHTFHDGILLWTCIGIVALVLALLVIVVVRFNAKANPKPSATTHNTAIEVVWTVAPILILVVIAIPSFSVLTDQLTMPDGERKYLGSNIFSFGEQEVPAPAFTIKATGAQWNWEYEYSMPAAAAPAADAAAAPAADAAAAAPAETLASFSSFMLNEADRAKFKPNEPRLLAVDNEIVVPVNATIRMQVTAAPDGVIHAFAVPSLRHQDRRRSRQAQRNLVQCPQGGHLLRSVLRALRQGPRLHAHRCAGCEPGAVRPVVEDAPRRHHRRRERHSPRPLIRILGARIAAAAQHKT